MSQPCYGLARLTAASFGLESSFTDFRISLFLFPSLSLSSVGSGGAEVAGRDLPGAAPLPRGRDGHPAGGERGEQGDAQGNLNTT